MGIFFHEGSYRSSTLPATIELQMCLARVSMELFQRLSPLTPEMPESTYLLFLSQSLGLSLPLLRGQASLKTILIQGGHSSLFRKILVGMNVKNNTPLPDFEKQEFKFTHRNRRTTEHQTAVPKNFLFQCCFDLQILILTYSQCTTSLQDFRFRKCGDLCLHLSFFDTAVVSVTLVYSVQYCCGGLKLIILGSPPPQQKKILHQK